jgi:hypothetical protein
VDAVGVGEEGKIKGKCGMPLGAGVRPVGTEKGELY